MNKYILLSALLSIYAFTLFGQQSRHVELSFSKDAKGVWQMQADEKEDIGLHFKQTEEGCIVVINLHQWLSATKTIGIALRTETLTDQLKLLGICHNEQQIFQLSTDSHVEGPLQQSKPLFIDSKYKHFILQWPDSENFHSISMYISDPGLSRPTQAKQIDISEDDACPAPVYKDRLGWCPDSTCPTDATPVFQDVSHLIVHHSAGGNNAADWDAVVRIIWDLHVNFNGWDDIGYNWLIAPDGTIYEGRGDDFRGAHFCGRNAKALGVCMLGTYENSLPPDTALSSLTQLLTAKSEKFDLPPLRNSLHESSNRILNHISGHRDGCATECPGSVLYAYLPTLRQRVYDSTEVNCPIVVATEAPNSLSFWQVSPNPTHGQILISGEDAYRGDVHLNFYNAQGQLIDALHTQKHSEQLELTWSLSGHSPGTYFLRINRRGSSTYQTIVFL